MREDCTYLTTSRNILMFHAPSTMHWRFKSRQTGCLTEVVDVKWSVCCSFKSSWWGSRASRSCATTSLHEIVQMTCKFASWSLSPAPRPRFSWPTYRPLSLAPTPFPLLIIQDTNSPSRYVSNTLSSSKQPIFIALAPNGVQGCRRRHLLWWLMFVNLDWEVATSQQQRQAPVSFPLS
jgi:hypothetical protein